MKPYKYASHVPLFLILDIKVVSVLFSRRFRLILSSCYLLTHLDFNSIAEFDSAKFSSDYITTNVELSSYILTRTPTLLNYSNPSPITHRRPRLLPFADPSALSLRRLVLPT